MARYCSACGNLVNEEDARFCPTCGAVLESEQPTSAGPTRVSEPRPHAGSASPQKEPPRRTRRRRHTGRLVLLVVLVLALLGGAISLMVAPRGKKAGSTWTSADGTYSLLFPRGDYVDEGGDGDVSLTINGNTITISCSFSGNGEFLLWDVPAELLDFSPRMIYQISGRYVRSDGQLCIQLNVPVEKRVILRRSVDPAPQTSVMTASSLVSASTTASVSSTTSTVPAYADPQSRSASWDFKSDSGYTCSLKLTVWDSIPPEKKGLVIHPGETRSSSDGYEQFSFDTGADYDPKTDVAIPIALYATNTTTKFSLDSFSARVSCSGVRGYKTASTRDLDFMWKYSDEIGTTSWKVGMLGDELRVSNSASNYWAGSVKWSEPVTPSGHRLFMGFAILHGYYSPAHPSGEVALLSNLVLSAAPDGAWQVVGDNDRRITLLGYAVSL